MLAPSKNSVSLYRYLPGKAELVALMVDRAMDAPPTLAPTDWRAGLKEWSHRLLASFLHHPWALEATVGPRPLGPNELGWMECAVSLLAGTGLTGAERLDAVAVLAGHVRMIAQQAGAYDQPETQFSQQVLQLLHEHGDRFPALSEAMSTAAAAEAQDQGFDFGLERILDGLQSLMIQRSTRGI